MNKEQKEQWIEALKSGEYKQCIGRLNKIDPDGTTSYCCLGVVQKLFDLKTAEVDHGYLEYMFLPTATQGNLIRRNDGILGANQWSFAEIADYIEDNVPTTE